jgi:CRISPR-associated protein Cmr2
MSHLLIVSIGPVQDFIASARRFRDLWFGSWVLSEVSRAAAKALAEAESAGLDSLIFPAPGSMDDLEPDQELGIANKVMALVSGDPASVARLAAQAARDRLKQLANEVFEEMPSEPVFTRERADAQIADLLEIQWAAVPVENYASARREAERWLSARKATRDFAPVSWGSEAPKSSLDGQREAVLDLAKADHPRAWQRKLGMRAGENLCGVGLLKRKGGEAPRDRHGKTIRIPSTGSIAALAAVGGARGDLQEAAEAYQKALQDLGAADRDIRCHGFEPARRLAMLDPVWLFEERLNQLFDEKEETAQLEQARQALKRFLRATGLKPQPYYAVLVADGDRMGKAIDRQTSAEAHRDLTRALASFSQSARTIVADHDGSLVYAGGDDVLALMPLHTVLDCAEALARDFAERLGRFGEGEEAPTLSVGVGIGHQMDPAADTLDLGRKAEKEAKKLRNAIALVVQKRGGGEMTVSGHWDGFMPRFRGWLGMLASGEFPDGAAYELRETARVLEPKNSASQEVKKRLQEAQFLEATRILGRKRTGNWQDLRKGLADEVLGHLKDGPDGGGKESRSLLARVADELVVARTFVAAGVTGKPGKDA